jgi:hypothetical protein
LVQYVDLRRAVDGALARATLAAGRGTAGASVTTVVVPPPRASVEGWASLAGPAICWLREWLPVHELLS